MVYVCVGFLLVGIVVWGFYTARFRLGGRYLHAQPPGDIFHRIVSTCLVGYSGFEGIDRPASESVGTGQRARKHRTYTHSLLVVRVIKDGKPTVSEKEKRRNPA